MPLPNPAVTIGSLSLRTYAINCVDWSDLFQTVKRGQNRSIPGSVGAAVRPRVAGEVRAALPIRLNGAFSGDTPFVGDTHDNVLTLYAQVAAVAANNTVQTLTFTRDSGSVTADCIVEELTSPQFETPSIATVVLDLTLPDGPVSL